MFTGIVQGTGEIIKIDEKSNFRTLHIKLPEELNHDIQIGASIAIDGCCLSVTAHHEQIVTFDAVAETLTITTLGQRKINDKINVERSLKFGSEIGGHIMSGHISCKGIIIKINASENNYNMMIEIPEKFSKYVLYKGFIGIDGASLTIGNRAKNRFELNLIPETLSLTTLKEKMVGDHVNIEFDTQTQTIVDTVERYLSQQAIS